MSLPFCDYPWTHFEVNNPNGDVTMCCISQTVLGNVREQSILEIWNGEKYQEIRKGMAERGAHCVCDKECPVLKGRKSYQNLDWYKDVPTDTKLFQNAKKNEEEIAERKLELESKPRWMRFAYSYACNLRCYHCYQEDDRKSPQFKGLPDEYIEEAYSLADYYQILFYFGGEPFLYPPTLKLLGRESNPWCRHFFITNATLLDDKKFELLENINIGYISVSMDAAEPEAYHRLRKGAKWDKVEANLKKLAELKRKKDFVFSIDMTVNSINAGQIEKFADMALSLGADPSFNLVNNPFETFGFQKDYLKFTNDQIEDMLAQVERSLEKVKVCTLVDPKVSLVNLKKDIITHAQKNNSLLKYAVMNVPYRIKNKLKKQRDSL